MALLALVGASESAQLACAATPKPSEAAALPIAAAALLLDGRWSASGGLETSGRTY
jgi:hypothetical protein